MRSCSTIHIATVACIVLLSAKAVAADDGKAIENIATGSTAIVAKIDTGQLDLPKVFRDAPAPVRDAVSQSISKFKNVFREQRIYVAVDVPFSTSIPVRVLAPREGIDWELVPELFSQPAEHIDRKVMGEWMLLSFQIGGSANHRHALSQLPAATESWTQIFGAMQDYPIQIGFRVPDYFRKTISELDPELPETVGAGSTADLMAQFKAAYVAIDPSKSIGRLTIETSSPSAAQDLSKRIPRALANLAGEITPESDGARMMALGAIGILRPEVQGSNLVVSLEDQAEAESMLQVFGQALQMAVRPIADNQSINNMKQMALAFHNYASAYQTFPPAKKYRDENGKSGLSWRVHLLPFMDEVELWQQFKLDEPWDSEHNIELLGQMPDVYKLPTPFGEESPVKPNYTVYLGPAGENSLWGAKAPLGFRNITDGTSNTIMFVQVPPEYAVPWTAPEEYVIDPEHPAAKLAFENGETNVAFMDGSVQRLKQSLKPEVWRALFTISGGEAVTID